MKECFRILRQPQFTGALVVENYIAGSQGTDPMDELRRALTFIRQSGW